MREREGREGKRERGEGGNERERGRGRVQKRIHMHMQVHSHTSRHAHTLCPYYYVLYTHPERDQCYNESRQSVPDASSGPGAVTSDTWLQRERESGH